MPKAQALLRPVRFKPTMLPGLQLWLPADQSNVFTGNASAMVSASSQYLSHADSAALRIGTLGFWASGWAKVTALNLMGIAGKDGDGSSREWDVYLDNADSKVKLQVFNGASLISASVPGVVYPGTGTWFHWFAWYDPTAATINVSLNGGTVASIPTTGPPSDSVGPFYIGSIHGVADMDGAEANVVFGKAVPGGFATTPATTIRNALYNNGAGIDLRTLSSATRTAWGLVSAWRLNEPSTGTRADDFGGNTLSNTNSVSGTTGPYTYAAVDGDPVRLVNDQSGRGNNVTQGTTTKQPLLKTNILNGKPAFLHDSTDDNLAVTFGSTLAQPTTIICVVRPNGFGNYATAYDGVDATNRQVTRFETSNGEIRVNAGGLLTSGVNAAAGTPIILTTVFNGASSFVRRNGTQIAAGNPGSAAQGGFRVGSKYDETEALNGYWFDGVVCTGQLSLADIARAERFYGRKYGLAVA